MILHLFAVTIGLVGVYFCGVRFFPWFFRDMNAEGVTRSVSVCVLIALSLLGYVIFFAIPDVESANRFLHGFSGGFVAYAACYFSWCDSKCTVGFSRAVPLFFLVGTALGVANELLEYAVQSVTLVPFATNVFDTWRDLASNTIGMGIAAIVFFAASCLDRNQ